MAAARVSPKILSIIGSNSAKIARPAVRSTIRLNSSSSARAYSGVRNGLHHQTSAFQSMKRQQSSNILNATTRLTAGRQSRAYSSEIASAMVEVSQNMGMGSAAIGLGGAGIGIGMVFAALLMGVARNPSMRGQLFSYAILGFAFVEAIGLFDLMVAMMCKYV